MKKILYEKDYSMREQLLSWFEQQKEVVEPCFSLEKLELLKRKFEGEDLVIFVRECDSDFKLIRDAFSNVLELNCKTPLLNVDQLLAESRTIASGIRRVGRYNLDLLCIGSSTGGLPVVQKTIKGIIRKNTIIVICQHINQQHNDNILDTLSKGGNSNIELVKESTILRSGHTYICGGGSDFEIRFKYGKLYLEAVGLSKEDYHPSFNTLTGSLRNIKGLQIGCMILSGLGNDGSKYLKELKSQQVKIIVQDPDQAIAPYMPKAAISTGVVDHIYDENNLHDYLKRSAA